VALTLVSDLQRGSLEIRCGASWACGSSGRP